jgi:hypothetical protein
VTSIDQQLKMARDLNFKRSLTGAIEIVRQQFPRIGRGTMRAKYNLWKKQGCPNTMIHDDQRHYHTCQRALSDQGEVKIVDQILDMNRTKKQVSFLTVRKLALEQWHMENNITPKNYSFVASDGWIQKFIKKHNLSSQLVSKHTSSNEPKYDPKVISEYKNKYHQFVEEHGVENVYNFDETSFMDNSGIRTIASKRTCHKNPLDPLFNSLRTDQPQIKNFINSNQRVSIGCTITAKGEKLKPILNVKGLTEKCMKKYGSKYSSHYLMTCTKTSWFREKTMLQVLELIHLHSQGKRSLCIWDSYKPHKQIQVLNKAKELNIELLEVPHGLTSKYQPLDYKFNGVFKSIMKSYWFNHRYGDDKENTCPHMCETIIGSYESISDAVVISSFDCVKF